LERVEDGRGESGETIKAETCNPKIERREDFKVRIEEGNSQG